MEIDQETKDRIEARVAEYFPPIAIDALFGKNDISATPPPVPEVRQMMEVKILEAGMIPIWNFKPRLKVTP